MGGFVAIRRAEAAAAKATKSTEQLSAETVKNLESVLKAERARISQLLEEVQTLRAEVNAEREKRLSVEGDFANFRARMLISRGARPPRGVADLWSSP